MKIHFFILFLCVFLFAQERNARFDRLEAKTEIQIKGINRTLFFDSLSVGNKVIWYLLAPAVQDSIQAAGGGTVNHYNSPGETNITDVAGYLYIMPESLLPADFATGGVGVGDVLRYNGVDWDYAPDSISVAVSKAMLTSAVTSSLDSVNVLEKKFIGNKTAPRRSLAYDGIFKWVNDSMASEKLIYSKIQNDYTQKIPKIESMYTRGADLRITAAGNTYVLNQRPEYTRSSVKVRTADAEKLYHPNPLAGWQQFDRDMIIYVRFSVQVDTSLGGIFYRVYTNGSNEYRFGVGNSNSIYFSAECAGKTTWTVAAPNESISYDSYYNFNTWHSAIITLDNSDKDNCKIYFDGESLSLSAATGDNDASYAINNSYFISVGNFDYAEMAVWRGEDIVDHFTDNTALYIHNSGYFKGDLNVSNVGQFYPAALSDSLAAYWTFIEGTGQYVYDQSGSGDDLFFGDDATVEADDPEWQAYSPDNPFYYAEHGDNLVPMAIAVDARWKLQDVINISPMGEDYTTDDGDVVTLESQEMSRITVYDSQMPNDTLFVSLTRHLDGGFHLERTNVIGLYRSLDGGHSWDSLAVNFIDGGTRQLSTVLDSIRPGHNYVYRPAGEDTLLMFFHTYTRTGDGVNDWGYGPLYMISSGDLGETWTDTTRVIDHLFGFYQHPAIVPNGDVLSLFGGSVEHNQGGAVIGDRGAGVLKYNWRTGAQTGPFWLEGDTSGFSQEFHSEFVGLVYDTVDTKLIAACRKNTTSLWIGYSDDYGETWTDSSTTYIGNTVTQPTLFMVKSPTTGLDSIIVLVRSRGKAYVLDSVQTHITNDRPFSDNQDFTSSDVSINTAPDWFRINPQTGLEAEFEVTQGPSIVQLDREKWGVGFCLQRSSLSEPYFGIANLMAHDSLDNNYKHPWNWGSVVWPGNSDGSTLYKYSFSLASFDNNQTVKIHYPFSGVSAEINENNQIDFTITRPGRQLIIFELLPFIRQF